VSSLTESFSFVQELFMILLKFLYLCIRKNEKLNTIYEYETSIYIRIITVAFRNKNSGAGIRINED